MKKLSSHLLLVGRGGTRGAALVIVLGFVVLLSVLALGFLSKATVNRQVSSANASMSKSKLFGQGAIDTIIGDLRQEVVDGTPMANRTAVVGPNGTTVTLYKPQTGTKNTVMPIVAVSPNLPAGAIPVNLVKESAFNTPFYTGASFLNLGPNRASNFSTATPSQNGRAFSSSRWNKPLFMATATAFANITDLTPIGSDGTSSWAGNDAKYCPSWVLVGRNGKNPMSSDYASSYPALSDPTNADYVVGRYAYTVYNEGALLDANVAGYPYLATPSATAGPMPATQVIATSGLPTSPTLTLQQVAPKMSVAFADLTQIPTLPVAKNATTAPATTLTFDEVNQLVGWRNHISAQPSGAFPALSFTSGSVTNFFNAVLSNSSGFSILGNTTAPVTNQTDRAFPTRQSLIQFLTQGAANGDNTKVRAYENALQYLTTYSRDLNQPSVWPDPNRPKIKGAWSAINSAPSPNWSNYQGNNDAQGEDDQINPSFLSVRVTTAGFSRFDGTWANIGDPLVSKRFPLCRLAWLTYLGPSASPTGTLDATYLSIVRSGVPQQTIDEGTAANIYKCFGLIWGSAANTSTSSLNPGNCWTYYHGSVTPPGGTIPAAGHILKLSEVAAQGREPDFVELLKAAITTGSLGKGGATSETSRGGNDLFASAAYVGIYQHTMDTTTDYQIIQIAANIIDQFDADGYPTWIQFNNNATFGLRDFFGIENLPYLQGDVTYTVTQTEPSPTPLPLDGVGGLGDVPTDTVHNPAQTRELIPPLDTTGNIKPMYEIGGSPATMPTALGAAATSGTGIAMVSPIVWNPYDANSSPGYPAPTAFRFTADSHDPAMQQVTPIFSGYNPCLGTYSNATLDPYTFNSSWYFLLSDGLGNTSKNVYATPTTQHLEVLTLYGFPNPTNSQINSSSTTVTLTPTQTELDFGPTTSLAFREPTALVHAEDPSALGPGVIYNLTLGAGHVFRHSLAPFTLFDGSGFSTAGSGVLDQEDNLRYAGVFVGSFPLRWNMHDPYFYVPPTPPSTTPVVNSDNNAYIFSAAGYWASADNTSFASPDATCRLDYTDSNGNWKTYDQKYVGHIAGAASRVIDKFGGSAFQYDGILYSHADTNSGNDGWQSQNKSYVTFFDPRSGRFSDGQGQGFAGPAWPTPYPSDVIGTMRANSTVNNPQDNWGFCNIADPGSAFGSNTTVAQVQNAGWFIPPRGNGFQASDVERGSFAQNNPTYFTAYPGATQVQEHHYYADPDGVVRRGMAAWTQSGNIAGTGLPTQTAYLTSPGPVGNQKDYQGGLATISATQAQSRPILLNRPFRSVADLGYVFRDEPFKNLDFFTSESGDASLLDVFCINEDNSSDAIVVGKVNLNTQQAPVLRALLSGANRDETQAYVAQQFQGVLGTNPFSELSRLTYNTASTVGLIQRTSDTAHANKGQLTNISELVGKYVAGYTNEWNQPYSGFSEELGGASFGNPVIIAPYIGGSAAANNIVQRYLETAIRALADVGTTRTWNLMIDVVAQTGHYPAALIPTATTDNFMVDGEQRYWVHVAIDRYTGKVIDENIELVKE